MQIAFFFFYIGEVIPKTQCPRESCSVKAWQAPVQQSGVVMGGGGQGVAHTCTMTAAPDDRHLLRAHKTEAHRANKTKHAFFFFRGGGSKMI